MKLLLLLMLLAIGSFAQEKPLAVKKEGEWKVSRDYAAMANVILARDEFDSQELLLVNDSEVVILLIGHTDSTTYTDRVVGRISGDTIFTQYDYATGVYFVECETTACCILCKKGVYGCICESNICSGTQTCTHRTLGGTVPVFGLSNAIRSALQ